MSTSISITFFLSPSFLYNSIIVEKILFSYSFVLDPLVLQHQNLHLVLKYVIHSHEYIIWFHIPLSLFLAKFKDQTSQIFSFILLFVTSKSSTYATPYPVHVSTHNSLYKSDSFLFRDCVLRQILWITSIIIFPSLSLIRPILYKHMIQL